MVTQVTPINLLEDYMEKYLLIELQNVRGDIESTLKNNILKHFTNHGLEHSDRMVKNLKELINDNLLSTEKIRLSENELFILILSIYLHDIGMHITKAHDITKNICDLEKEDFISIRDNHGEISAKILEESIRKKEDIYGIKINFNKPLIKTFSKFVCQVISKHQSKFKYNPQEKVDFEGKQVRIGILIALLRIIDKLDCDHNRIDIDQLLQFSIPGESLLHWAACIYVDSVTIDDGNIKIIASYPDNFPPTHIDILNKYIIGNLNEEIELVKDELWKSKIKISFDNQVHRQKGEYSSNKWSSLPDEILKIFEEQIVLAKPKYTTSFKEEDIKKIDWLSYWSLIGNPFLDKPLAFGSEQFVETKKVKSILSEINNLVSAKQGDVRLLIGERGLGKTSLFQLIKGKFEGYYQVNIIDAADVVSNVNTATELHNKLFEKTDKEMFGITDENYNKNNFLEKINKTNFRIICIDSLDRLPSEKENILDEFFKISQHSLTFMKNKIMIILSCSDKWRSFLESKNLSYLGYKNQWSLGGFEPNEAKIMLSKRIEASGKNFNDIFEHDCIAPLQALSNGNPRMILTNAEYSCRLAFTRGIKKINVEFIENEFGEELEKTYDEFLEKQCRKSQQFKEGLVSTFLFFTDLERRNLDRNLGVDLLSQLSNHKIVRDTILIQYYFPLNYVANTTLVKENNGIAISKFVLLEKVKKFINIIKDNGYEIKDFLSFYSRLPFIPQEDKENIINQLKDHQESYEDIQYYEQARIDYNDLKKSVIAGHLYFRKSWDVIQNMIAAILIKTNDINPHDYVLMIQEPFYEDRYGIKRYKNGAGKILADQAYILTTKLKNSMKMRDIWINNYHHITWIRDERSTILRSSSQMYEKYGDKKLVEMCSDHLKRSYIELLEIYDRVKRSEQ